MNTRTEASVVMRALLQSVLVKRELNRNVCKLCVCQNEQIFKVVLYFTSIKGRFYM